MDSTTLDQITSITQCDRYNANNDLIEKMINIMKINTLFCLNCMIFLCFALLSCSIISAPASSGKQKSHSGKLENSLNKLFNKNCQELNSSASRGNDSNLQITGDASVYQYKQIKVSKDGGKTYKTIDTYEGKVAKEDMNTPSAKIGGIGAIFADSDGEEPKIYRLRNDVYFIFEIVGSELRLVRGPVPISQSEEHLPIGLTAAVHIGKGYYLFFKANQFCRRKLKIEKSENQCPDGFKDNTLLFNCKNTKQESHSKLCKNAEIDGAAMVQNRLLLFKKDKFWVFKNSTPDHPGYFANGDLEASEKFDGFVGKNDGITSFGSGKSSKVIMLNDRKWWMWSSDTKVIVNGKKIDETKSSDKQINEISAKVSENKDNDETWAKDSAHHKSADRSYPSEKDGVYGSIIQLDQSQNPKFVRLRGKQVYYFTKKGKKFEFNDQMISISKTPQKFPPDINVVFKGPDQRYYFIREENYCRRPLDVSGVGLDPPDYCPEGGDLRELLGCNIRFYEPNVDELCHNPMIDNAFVTSDGKSVYLFRERNYWILNNLPLNASFSPSKCMLSAGGDATKIWKNFSVDPDAIFSVESGPDMGRVIQFSRLRYKIWDIKGGEPIEEGIIVEKPLKTKTTATKPEVTEKPVVTKTQIINTNNIVYTKSDFKNFCLDPVIEAADSNLNGSEVYLIKDSRYFVLTGLRERDVGKLTKTGLTKDLWQGFQPNVTAIMTCKEGYRRGYSYQYYGKNNWSSWDLNYKPVELNQSWVHLAPNGFNAVLHNRNVSDPVMIGLDGSDVFYFSTAGHKFARKRRQVKFYESIEQFPARVEAAFSMPNGLIYLFRNRVYCVRQMFYTENPPYCPKWRDTRQLLGCFGQINNEDKKSKNKVLPNDIDALSDLCSNLDINDADRLWQREDQLYVWRGARYWHLTDFPDAPRVIGAGPSSDLWTGFSEDPDAVVIVQEGIVRRGWMFAMFGGHWSSWYPDNKPWVGYKSWWGHPIGALRFDSMMHNGDIINPQVLGFEGKYVHYYKTDGTQLSHEASKKLSVTAEVWPQNITAAFRMEDNTVYLFRKHKYCKRKWKCTNSSNNCCKAWKHAKDLFGCISVADNNKDNDSKSNS